MASHQSPVTSHQSPSLDVRAALKEGMARLRRAGVPSHTLAAELLLMHVTGRDRAWLYAHPEELLAAAEAERYFDLVIRRVAGTPTQYLTGKQEFWGLEFAVEPGVLIPRPETEHVIEVALARLGPPRPEEKGPAGTGLRIADVGTGSGCLAVALAHELPDAEIFATDISEAALRVARRNAERHNARVQFIRCSMLDFFLHQSPVTNHQSLFHLIVSNPPYIGSDAAAQLPREVGEHEPREALVGGPQGAEIYEPLVKQAAALLAPRGLLVLELGHDSLERVQALFETFDGWTNVSVTCDLAGIPRVLAAERFVV